MNRIALLFAATCALAPPVFAPVPALAHGDEVHGQAPPPPSASADSRTATATTTAMELVVRWPAKAAAAGPLRFRVLVSDYASNAPIEAPQVELTFSIPGKPDTTATIPATTSPGVFEADVALTADAHYAVSTTIIAGEFVDVAAIPDVEIGPPPVVPEAADDHGSAWFGIAASALVLAASLVALLVFRRRRRARAAAASVVAALILFAGGARSHGGEHHSEKPAVNIAKPSSKSSRVFVAKESQFLLGIRTAIVETRALADRVIVPGAITAPPERHAPIFAAQSGRVAPPRGGFPQLGARIKKGQTLGVVEAVLSAPERASFLSEAARARSDYATASARLDAAEKAKARLESLAGVSSRQQIEAAEVDLAGARATLVDAESRRAAFTSSAGVSQFELVAPIDGLLADIAVSPGRMLAQGDRAFLVLDPTELRVEAKVPEHELGRLTGGDSGDGEAVVSVEAFPDRSFPGKLLAQGQVIDDATRTAKVIFSVKNDEALLKLGMFARVQIGAGADKQVIAVPDAAILDIDGRRVVYVHTAPEEFEAKEIAVGRRDGDMLEVVQGLEAGARVVVVGANTLRNAPAR